MAEPLLQDPLDDIESLLKGTMEFLGAPAQDSDAPVANADMFSIDDLDILGPSDPGGTGTSGADFNLADLGDLDLGSPPPKMESLTLASNNPLEQPAAIDYDVLGLGSPGATEPVPQTLGNADRSASTFEATSLSEEPSERVHSPSADDLAAEVAAAGGAGIHAAAGPLSAPGKASACSHER